MPATYTCTCCHRTCDRTAEPPMRGVTAGGGGIAAGLHYPLCSWCGDHTDAALFTYCYRQDWPCPFGTKTTPRRDRLR